MRNALDAALRIDDGATGSQARFGSFQFGRIKWQV